MDEGISKFFHSSPGLAESLAPASMLNDLSLLKVFSEYFKTLAFYAAATNKSSQNIGIHKDFIFVHGVLFFWQRCGFPSGILFSR